MRYDAANHDIANSMEELHDFEETVLACFVKSGVFLPASSGANGQRHMFITERVRQQTRDKVVVRAGSRDIVLWGSLKEAELKDIAERTRVAAETMLNRVRIDLGGLRRHFSCFSLRAIGRALDNPRKPGLREQLIKSVGVLARTFQLDCRFIELEYADAISIMKMLYDDISRSQQIGNAQPAACHAYFDNRILWKRMLDEAFIEKHFASRVARFSHLPLLIRIWISILDGECQIERDLGELKEFMTAMSTANDDFLDDLLVLKLNGGSTPEAIATKSASGDFMATEFTLKCVEQWRATFGNRYGIDLSSRKPRHNPKSSNSFQAVRRSVLHASKNVKNLMGKQGFSGRTGTAYNVPLERLWGNTAKHLSPHWNQELQRFEKLTNLRRPGGLSVSGSANFPKWKDRPAFTTGHKAQDPSFYRLLAYVRGTSAASGAQNAADPDGISEASGAQLVNTAATGREFLKGAHRCRKSHLVILDSLERLHDTDPNELLLVHLLYIVALGLPVTTHALISTSGGDFSRLKISDIFEHQSAMSKEASILVADEFKKECPEAMQALRSIVSLANSNWRLVKPHKAKKEKTLIEIKKLRDLWDWTASKRLLVNSRSAKMAWSTEKPYTM